MSTATLHDGDVVAAVDEVLPLVRRSSDEIRRSRRLTGEVERALRAAGVYRMMLPRELGGLEVPVDTAMDVIERLSAADASTGWCAAIGAGSNVFAGYLPREEAAEVFADPSLPTATMFAALGTLREDDGGTWWLEGAGPSSATASTSSGSACARGWSAATATSSRRRGSCSSARTRSPSRTRGTPRGCRAPAATTCG
jgi:alkylation response protein AidB-like acyl-CoA dehydrogenase